MRDYYLAVDIGASSGRHVLGYMEKGRFITEEVYRFENGMTEKQGTLCWDTEYLFKQIIQGMKNCKSINKVPVSVGIDTWAVDFVLLDQEGNQLGDAVAYRDSRTEGMDKKVYAYISEEELYERTGIQKQPFNTIYQLMALKVQAQIDFKKASKLLMIPDYFHYLLTGVMQSEYTNATTTQLVDPKTRNWDFELIELLGYDPSLFAPIIEPGTFLSELTPEIRELVGYNCKVYVPATHDTASAVMAVPTKEKGAVYLSSGTWSLMGKELNQGIHTSRSREKNFTNEGGYNGTIRYLKNIMGLWMIQCVKKELEHSYSFEALCHLANQADINTVIDCDDQRLIVPHSMIETIKVICEETKQQVPVTEGELAKVIYASLAKKYEESFNDIEKITGEKADKLHIVGGGAKADYLNRLTAKRLKKTVLAGPVEATAIGNLMSQMLADQVFPSWEAARICVKESTELIEYTD